MAYVAHLFLLGSLWQQCSAYVNFENLEIERYVPFAPVPTPWFLPRDMVEERLPSMITAIAPSLTMADNGTYETMYSLHYHHHFIKKRVGKGLFERGVFAGDPPVATCQPCGYQTTKTTVNSTTTTTKPTASCTIHTYVGVFRSTIYPNEAASAQSVCYAAGYTGALVPIRPSSSGLPCCFTIPDKCKSNSSTSYTFTSGVFRSSVTMSFLSNTTQTSNTGATTSSTASPGSRSSSGSSRASTGAVSSSRSTALPLSAITSVTVISSQTITLTLSTSSSSKSATGNNSPSDGSSSLGSMSGSNKSSPFGNASPANSNALSSSFHPKVTLSVVTALPQSPSITSTVITVNNTIEGCGTASGSGVLIGTGTVYFSGGVSVVSSGTISGFATSAVGCGTILATFGSFNGSATIFGCGTGSGSGILDGTGTVYPAMLGGLVGITSSGRITGSGKVIGCGTITGSGTFTATQGLVTTSYFTLAPQQTTVGVYLSYCPTDIGNGLPRLAGDSWPRIHGNVSDSDAAAVSDYPVVDPAPTLNSSTNTTPTLLESAVCHLCSSDAGICCPHTVTCGADGYCPWEAMVRAGYVLMGYNIANMKDDRSGSGVAKWDAH